MCVGGGGGGGGQSFECVDQCQIQFIWLFDSNNYNKINSLWLSTTLLLLLMMIKSLKSLYNL